MLAVDANAVAERDTTKAAERWAWPLVCSQLELARVCVVVAVVAAVVAAAVAAAAVAEVVRVDVVVVVEATFSKKKRAEVALVAALAIRLAKR